MSSQGTYRKVGLPGRREREALKRGALPRNEREQAYVDAHAARLQELNSRKSRSPASREDSHYSPRRSREDSSRRRSPSRNSRYRSRSPIRSRDSRRRSPSRDRYRSRSPHRTREHRRRSPSRDHCRSRSSHRTRDSRRRSPSRDRYRSRSPRQTRESRKRSPSRDRYRSSQRTRDRRSPSHDRHRRSQSPRRSRDSRMRSSSRDRHRHSLVRQHSSRYSPHRSRDYSPRRSREGSSRRSPPRSVRQRSRSPAYDRRRRQPSPRRRQDSSRDSQSQGNFRTRTPPRGAMDQYRPSEAKTQDRHRSPSPRRPVDASRGQLATPATLSRKTDHAGTDKQSTAMGPPIQRPVKLSTQEDATRKPGPLSTPVTPAAQQGKGASHLPTPVSPSQSQQQQADTNFDFDMGGDMDDEESNGDDDEFPLEDLPEDWIEDFWQDGNNPVGGAALPKELSIGTSGVFGHLAAQALVDPGITPEMRTTIIQAIETAPDNDKLANCVRPLVQVVLDGAAGQGVEPHRFSFRIAPNWQILLDDILSLYHLHGQEDAAWFTENIIHSVLDLEARHVGDVYVESHLDHFLSEDYDRVRQSDVADAVAGKAPAIGWPFMDVKSTHSRIVGTINPSGKHWIAFEFVLATSMERAKLFYYNSLSSPNGKNKGRTFKTATEILPQVLYLASLRPGSPLAGFDPYALDVEEVPCPQQCGTFDCGPFAIYCTVKRLHNQSVWIDLPSPDIQSQFGRWLREKCALVLWYNHNNATMNNSFREIFEAQRVYDLKQAEIDRLQAEEEDLLEAKRRFADEAVQHHLEQFLAEDADKIGADPCAADSEQLGKKASSKENAAGAPLEFALPQHVLFNRGPELDLDEDEDEDADVQDCSTQYQSIRLEFGKRNDEFPSIIVILRWSSRPHWWINAVVAGTAASAIFENFVRELAQAWLDVYCQSVGIADANMHFVIHAMTTIQTRYMPVPLTTCEEFHGAEDMVGEDENGEDESRFSARCPICDYTCSSAGFINLYNRMGSHIGTHVPQLEGTSHAKQQPSGSEFSCKCPWEGCDFKSSGKNRSSVMANVRKHFGRSHGKEWSEAQGQSLQYFCHCSARCSKRPWSDLKALNKHAKSLENHTKFQCPYDGKNYKTFEILQGHIFHTHWNEGAPPGYYQCNIELLDLSSQCWSAIQRTVKLRLLGASQKQCAWALAGTDCCESDFHFSSEAKLQEHYDTEHSADLWPYTTDHESRCAALFPSSEDLMAHKMRVHKYGYKFQTQSVKFTPHLYFRARAFTDAITKDLLQFSPGRLQEDAGLRASPVLISVGVDGFTCNTHLLLEWLRNLELNFTLAIVSNNISTLDERDFTDVDGAWVGLYDSNAILSNLLDRTQAPRKYSQLFALWDRKQAWKDETSKLYTKRNVKPRGFNLSTKSD